MTAPHNRDMPFMLDALGLTDPNGGSRKPDHDRGNRMLAPLYDDVLKELAARYDPSVDDLDAPGTLCSRSSGVGGEAWPTWGPGRRDAGGSGARRDYALGLDRSGATRTGATLHRRRTPQSAARPRRDRRGRARARRGVVRVRVACAERIRDCAGSLSLTRRGKRLARPASISLGVGQSKVLRLRLTRAARRVLAPPAAGSSGDRGVAVTVGNPALRLRASAAALGGFGPEQVGERGAHRRAVALRCVTLGCPALEPVQPRLEQIQRRSETGKWWSGAACSATSIGCGPGCCNLTRARSMAYLVTRQRPSICLASSAPSSMRLRTAGGGRSSSWAVSGMPQVSI